MSITNFFKRSVTEEELPGKAGMEVPTAKKARLDDDVAAPPADGKNLAPLFGGNRNTTAASSNSSSASPSISTQVPPPVGSIRERALSLPPSWSSFFQTETNKAYFIKLDEFVSQEKNKGKTVYPPIENVFSAFFLTPFDKISVVIVGQDPYHGPGQAHGLAFSVLKGVQVPPSLQNMYKELEQDPLITFKRPTHGYLESWAKQGVFMLNTCLTVRKGEANSHKGQGWETFTDAVIRELNTRNKGLVFLLWGKPAETKCKAVDKSKHTVLTAPHPSPLSASRGWFGCRHFSLANEALKKRGKPEIDWQL